MKKGKKAVIITTIAILSLILVTFTVGIAVDGSVLKKNYLEPWKQDYYTKFEDPRLQLVAHALLAANAHNLQSWKIALDEFDNSSFSLYVNTERLSPTVDPYSRQITISQGTFLEYLRIAGKQLGYEVKIELFPEGEYDAEGTIESMKEKPVAEIKLTEQTKSEQALYEYLFYQDTHRGRYLEQKLTVEQLIALQTCSETDLEVRSMQDEGNLTILDDLVYRAADIEANITEVYEETKYLMRTNEWQKNKYRYGFMLGGPESKNFGTHLMQIMLTLFPGLNSKEANYGAFMGQINTVIAHTPAYIMLLTPNNTRTTQVLTGMLYSRVVLTARSMGLVMQPLSQALEEYLAMQEIYQEIHEQYATGNETIQMLARIGEPVGEAPLSMRMDVRQLLA